MGLFDIFGKKKTDMEEYYEERDKRQAGGYSNGNDSYENAFGNSFRITVEDVFAITGRGTVITGKVQTGSVRVGEEVTLRKAAGGSRRVTVAGIESFRKIKDSAKSGENVGILLRDISKGDIAKGDILEK